MRIVADSGSTKTAWQLTSANELLQTAQTTGLNPYFASESSFEEALNASEIARWPIDKIEEVYFYCAGVTDKKAQIKLENWLKSYFKDAIIRVESDLLGAARATYGGTPGIIGILGTGSNSGYYNGKEVAKNIRPLGFILGDEGSGSALGKALLVSFFRDELPDEIADNFKKFYPDYEDLLSNVYTDKRASRLLASFAPFIHQHLGNDYIYSLVRDEFARYFALLAGYSESRQVAFIGSVAYYFEDILQEIAATNGFLLHKVLKSPIDALALYHQQAN